MTDHNIGVDISKSHLDAFRLEDGAAQRFDNSAVGFRSLTKWLGKAPVARFVFEPTTAPFSACKHACQTTGQGMFTCPRGGGRITRPSRRRLVRRFLWSR